MPIFIYPNITLVYHNVSHVFSFKVCFDNIIIFSKIMTEIYIFHSRKWYVSMTCIIDGKLLINEIDLCESHHDSKFLYHIHLKMRNIE